METMTLPNQQVSGGHLTTATNIAPEQAIINRYKQACVEVEDAIEALDKAAVRVKTAKAERSRLYKLASTIDPSLKVTRPKS